MISNQVGSQIYHWDANDLQIGTEPDDCILPDIYATNEYTLGNMNTSNGNSMYSGNLSVLLSKNECNWHSGIFSLGLQNYSLISNLTYPNWTDDNHFFILGRSEVLANNTGWPIYPPSYPPPPSSINYLLDYGAREFYFNFPVVDQIGNLFYTFKIKILNPNPDIGKSSRLVLGVNIDYENENDPFDEWLQGENLTTSIIANHRDEVHITTQEYEFVEMNFQINEIPFENQSNNCQVGITYINPPSDIILMDEFILDCDQKNISFDFEIKKCNLDQLESCDKPKHCLRLLTSCQNINFNNYIHKYKFQHKTINYSEEFDGQGEYTQLDLEHMPAGEYNVTISYITTNGYNVKVQNSFYMLTKNYLISPIHNYTIDQNTTFENPIYVPKNIIVSSNSTLTINEMAYFKDGTSLIVEPGGALIVQGFGHLTACENRWEGVVAEGNANVIVRNNGSISYAKKGIYAAGEDITTITLNRAHFNNNLISLHALKSASPTVELSYFTEGQKGVLLDNVTGGTAANGVYFKGNEFAFMTQEGILSYNTPIQVEDGNEFSYCYDGIALRDLFGSNQQSFISTTQTLNGEEYNYFENNQNAIYTNGADVNIERNVFENNGFGGYYSGIGAFESEMNSYSGGNGENFLSTGNNSNYSQFNDYTTGTGITSQYNNDRYTFLSNCFQTSVWDMFAYGGNIALAQGGLNIAASNCFTGTHNLDFVCLTSNQISYFTPKPMVAHPLCLIPSFQSNFEEKKESDTENSGYCGTNLNAPSPGEYSYIRSLGCNITSLNNYITYLKSQIVTLSNQQILSDLDKANLSWLSRHLRYAQQRLARCLRKQGLKQDLYTFYKAQSERDFDINAASVLFDMGNTSQALLSLDTVWNTYGGDSLVLEALKLNILYRDSINQTSLDSNDVALLRTVSSKSDPYAGYARGLLYKITGERIEPDTSVVMPRNRVNKSLLETENYILAPNPVNDVIKMSIEHKNEDSLYKFEIFDIAGRKINQGILETYTMINVQDISDGIYFMKISKDGIPTITKKIFIVK